jgi:hypothetical protein
MLMRLAHHDVPLVPLLVPVIALGLSPLLLLPLVGFLGFTALGVLVVFAAIMVQMEEQGDHAYYVVSHGQSLPRREHAGYRREMSSLMQTLWAAKIVGAGLVVLGIGGFVLT